MTPLRQTLQQKIVEHAPTILKGVYAFKAEAFCDPKTILVPFEVPTGCTLFGVPLAQSPTVTIVGNPERDISVEVELDL